MITITTTVFIVCVSLAMAGTYLCNFKERRRPVRVVSRSKRRS